MTHPYIPNSAPDTRARMLAALGLKDIDELYAEIPERLRFHGSMNLPEPYADECSLRRHVEGILQRNSSCGDFLSFLGAGCYRHHVPSICDEVNQRGEFLTAYAGEPYDDHGRFQALFEYQSLMGELLDMDVVNVPTFHGFQAAATAARMAARIVQRREVLVPRRMAPSKRSFVQNYCESDVVLREIPDDVSSGLIDQKALAGLISTETAAVYFETPAYLGGIEDGAAITRLAHEKGVLAIACVDPISLGVLAPPGEYGADIACGEIQPLGIHMQYGGGHGGFIATRDEERFVMEFPSRLFGIAPTRVTGEYGFGDVAYERTSFARREGGKEFVGTAAALWGITAGVYLALMGPQGMREVGEGILQRSRYAASRLGNIPGVRAPFLRAAPFKEFVVNFDGTGRSVFDVNRALRARGIFGGKDLSSEFPELGASALYCFTEVHTRADIDRLAAALKEIVTRR